MNNKQIYEEIVWNRVIFFSLGFVAGYISLFILIKIFLPVSYPEGYTCSPINQEICWSIDNGEYQMQGMTPNASLIYYAHCTPVKGSCFDYGVKWENGTRIPQCDEVGG